MNPSQAGLPVLLVETKLVSVSGSTHLGARACLVPGSHWLVGLCHAHRHALPEVVGVPLALEPLGATGAGVGAVGSCGGDAATCSPFVNLGQPSRW
jgi:hypothetical protein